MSLLLAIQASAVSISELVEGIDIPFIPTANLSALIGSEGEIIAGSYLVELQQPSLAEYASLSDESISFSPGFETTSQHRTKLIEEHARFVNRFSLSLSPLVHESLWAQFIFFIKKLFGITGRVVDSPAEIALTHDYYTLFHGVALANVSTEDLNALKQLPEVKGIYPVYRVHTLLDLSLPLINVTTSREYDTQKNKCILVGSKCIEGSGVKVAIIDTGIDYLHPDLGGCFGTSCKVASGWDFVNNDSDPMDENGHGTHVAGIVAANGGVQGVAPNATLIAYRVLDENGYGSWTNILAGLERSVDPNQDGDFSDRADIISMSLGGPGNPDDLISRAVDRAVKLGSSVVIAAGNNGPYRESIGSPGTAQEAITVGATFNNVFRTSELRVNGTIVTSSALYFSKTVTNLSAPLRRLTLTSPYALNLSEILSLGGYNGSIAILNASYFTPQDVLTAEQAGALGVIFIGDENPYFYPLSYRFASIPAISVSWSEWEDVLSTLSSNSRVNISVYDNITVAREVVYFSSRGPVIWSNGSIFKPDVVAPGHFIYSTYLGGGYGELSGTSMAAPHVAGVAALMKEVHPDWSARQIKSALRTNALSSGSSHNNEGYGVVNAFDSIFSDTPIVAVLETHGVVQGIVNITGFIEGMTSGIITLSYGQGEEPTSWTTLPSPTFTLGRFSVLLNSFYLDEDTLYTLRLNVQHPNGTDAEDRTLFKVNNINITGSRSYDIVRAGDYIPFSLSFVGITEQYPDFRNYTIDYVISNFSISSSQHFLACNAPLAGTFYASASTTLCTSLPFSGPLFILNTSFATVPSLLTVRVRAHYGDHSIEEHVSSIYIDPTLKKGWPQALSYGNSSLYAGDLVPLVSDLDHDGKKEIIVNVGRAGPDPFSTLRVYHANGSLWWSREVGRAFTSDIAYGYSDLTPSVTGDINNDGKDEILVYQTNWNVALGKTGGYLFAYNYTGGLLEGWPINVTNDFYPTMLVSDLDHDGYGEIVIQTSAFEDVQLIVISKGKLFSTWTLPPYLVIYSWVVYFPAVGNFDEDPDLEIIAALDIEDSSPGSSVQSFIGVYNKDGSSVSGWPLTIPQSYPVGASPVVGDINNDGQDDIALTISNNGSKLYAFHRNTSILTGFPATLAPLTRVVSNTTNFTLNPVNLAPLSLGDSDKQGKLDIAFHSWGSLHLQYPAYLFSSNGSLRTGWPKYSYFYQIYGPIIHESDKGEDTSIFTAAGAGFYNVPLYENITNTGGIYAWNKAGIPLPSFPKATQFYATAPAAIADLDNDGFEELIGSSNIDLIYVNGTTLSKQQGSLYVWDLNLSHDLSLVDWEMYRKDAANTGCYSCSFDGRSTDLRYLSNYSVKGFTFEKIQYGKIVFHETINVVAYRQNYSLFDRYVFISRLKMNINSTALSIFNRSAQLSFYHVSFSDPAVLYNTKFCPASICTQTVYNTTLRIFSVNVTHFSSFELVENPIIQVVLTAPSFGLSTNKNQSFACHASMRSPDLTNVTFYIWNETSLVYSTSLRLTGQDNSSTFSFNFSREGTYYWNCLYRSANDISRFASINNSIRYDLTPPLLQVISPFGVQNISQFSVSLNERGTCSYSLNNGILNVSMNSVDNSTFFARNESLQTGLAYSVLYTCTDTAGNWGLPTWTSFTLDTLSPNVTLVSPSPLDGVRINSSNASISFSWRVSDVSSIQKCFLSISNNTHASLSSITDLSKIYSFNDTFSPGLYTWHISCIDAAGNLGNSSRRSVRIVRPIIQVQQTTSPTQQQTSSPSGGNAPVAGCVPTWNCVWGTCVNGIQTTSCTDTRACNTNNGRPQVASRACTPNSSAGTQANSNATESDTEKPGRTDTEKMKDLFSLIGIFILLIALVGVGIFIARSLYYHHRSKKYGVHGEDSGEWTS